MAPQWVLLDRSVIFVRGAATIGRMGKEAAGIVNRRIGYSEEERMKATADRLEAMKPGLHAFDPPKISRLGMVRYFDGGPICGTICSTDKALVVFYAGFYQPGFCGSSSSGCHMVYDASKNSLSAIPQLPEYSPRIRGLGLGAAILSLGEGAYVIAELVAVPSDFPCAGLYLWRSSPTPNHESQWSRSFVELPHQVFTPEYSFDIDMAFSYNGSSVCWVDLLQGVLVCNLLTSPPEFRFVPLPEGSLIHAPLGCRPSPEQFRTMGCQGGLIRFVSLVGFYEGYSSYDMKLTTWSLSPDLKEWKACSVLSVGDLMASKSFQAMGLPDLAPWFPVLSMGESEDVCVMLHDVDHVQDVDEFGQFCGVHIKHKAHYVLRIDTVRNEVLESAKGIPNSMTPDPPVLLASDFTTYLQGSEGALEATSEIEGEGDNRCRGTKDSKEDQRSASQDAQTKEVILQGNKRLKM